MKLPSFTNWRTTAAGAGALVFAVADLVVMFHNKEWDGNKLGMDVLAILTGLGLVAARDAVASEQAHKEDRVAIAETAVLATVAVEKAAEAKEVAIAVEEKVS